MPYVQVPKELNKVKTKVVFNLTKRQLIWFGSAAVVSVPAYFLTRSHIGNTPAMLLEYAQKQYELNKEVQNIVNGKQKAFRKTAKKNR